MPDVKTATIKVSECLHCTLAAALRAYEEAFPDRADQHVFTVALAALVRDFVMSAPDRELAAICGMQATTHVAEGAAAGVNAHAARKRDDDDDTKATLHGCAGTA